MSASALEQRMQLGHAARRAGRADEALEHYRTAVEQEPESTEANTVYGLMLLQLGRAGEAEAPLRKAVAIAPAHPAARMNLAQWLAQQGRADEAVGVVEGIVADEPNRHWAWERLGELEARLRRFGEAASHFRRAADLQPRDPSILYKLARAHFDGGERHEAGRVLAEAAALAPGTPAILGMYADLHDAAGDWTALEQAAITWSRAAPRDPAPLRALARAQWQGGFPRRAMESYQRSFELGGRSAETLAVYGRICMHALEVDAALAAFEESERLDPKNASMLSGRSVLLMWKGDAEGARRYGRRALEVDPGDVTAYKTLAQLADGRLGADEAAGLRRAAESEGTRTPDRITALYTLGDCLDKDGRIDQAFDAYSRANGMLAAQAESEGLRYDRAKRRELTAELESIFATVPRPPAPAQPELPVPIFIVGMPRSGTTLVESVIGAHSKVVAGGELPGIRWMLPEFLDYSRSGHASAIGEAHWAKWRSLYREMLPRRADARAVTDKNPWNYDAIGIIPRLFPGARIFHVRRNPIETGFSIWRNEFSKLVRFASRLEDIGHYYGEYARVMAHWERVAGDAFTTIQYEDFVGRFDEAARELIAACGLEWEEGCGRFWESGRTVSTISTMQVRRPPKKASARADAYGERLAPLADSLREMRVDLETGKYRGDS